MAWTTYLNRISVDDTFDTWRIETNKSFDVIDEYRVKIDTEDQLNSLTVTSGVCDDYETSGTCSVTLDFGVDLNQTNCVNEGGSWNPTHENRNSCETSGHVWTPHQFAYTAKGMNLLTISGGEDDLSNPQLDHSMTQVRIFSTQTSTSYDTGALVVEGGVGIHGNLNVKGDINFLAGENSAGSITFGDDNTDNVVFGADVNSDIIPNTDDTFDLGSSTQQWKDIYIDGIANLDQTTIITDDGAFSVSGSNKFDIDVAAASRIVTSVGDITIDSEAGTLILDGHTSVDIDSASTVTIDSGTTSTLTSQTGTTIHVVTNDLTNTIDSGDIVNSATNSTNTLSNDFNVNATNDIDLDASNNIEITATEKVDVDGNYVDITATQTIDADGNIINLDGTNSVNIGGAGTTNNVNVTAQTNVELEAVQSVNITSAEASNYTTNNGRLTISGDDGVTIDGNNATTIIEAGGQTVDINATTLDVDTTGAINLDAATTSNFTSAQDIDIVAAANLDLDGETVNIDATDTTNGVKIATTTSGVPVTIGHATSEVTFSDNVTVTGNLTVQGDTTTVNTETMVVEDKNIELGNVTNPTNATADGGGFTLHGDTDHTITWYQTSGGYWNIGEKLNVDNIWVDANTISGDTTLNIESSTGTVNIGNGTTTNIVDNATNYTNNSTYNTINTTDYVANATNYTLVLENQLDVSTNGTIQLESDVNNTGASNININSNASDTTINGYNIDIISQNRTYLHGGIILDGLEFRNNTFKITNENSDLLFVGDNGTANLVFAGEGGTVIQSGPEVREPWNAHHPSYVSGTSELTQPDDDWGTCTLKNVSSWNTELGQGGDLTYYSANGVSEPTTKTACTTIYQCHLMADDENACNNGGGAWVPDQLLNYQCVLPFDPESGLDHTESTCIQTGGVWSQASWTQPIAQTGHFRFNTDTGRFEGFDGTAFRSIDGVFDTDNDTYIRAEETTTGDQDTLEFFTAGTERLHIDSTGIVPETNNDINLGSNSNQFKNIWIDSTAYIDDLNVEDTTDSSSKSTGALTVAGGVGIAKNLNVGVNTDLAGTLNVDGATTLDKVTIATADGAFNVSGANKYKLTSSTSSEISVTGASTDLSITSQNDITIDADKTNTHDNIINLGPNTDTINIGKTPSYTSAEWNTDIYLGERTRKINNIDYHATVHVMDKLKVYGGFTLLGASDSALVPVGGVALGEAMAEYIAANTNGAGADLDATAVAALDEGFGISFDRDSNTYIYAEADDDLRFVVGNTQRGQWNTSGLAVNDTKHTVISVGTTIQRPTTSVQGGIRYNTTDSTFEGYDGSNWGSLGGVKDVDQDTYISAESAAGQDEDILTMVAADQTTMTISKDGDNAWGNVSVTGNATISKDLTISGDLTVSGTTTTINTETVNIQDNIIVLNSNADNTPSENGGIEIERGNSTNASLTWIEDGDYWKASNQFRVDNIKVDGSEITTTNTDGNLKLSTNGTGRIDINAELKDANLANGELYIGGAGNITKATLSAGEGIDITNAAGSITIDAEKASSTNLGVAKFSTDNFAVSATGNVTIKDDGVALGTETTGNYVDDVSVGTNANGLSVTHTAGEGSDATIEMALASTSVVGTAKFSSSNFAVSATGNVTIKDNGVILGTETTGNYVKKGATSGNGISGSVDSEGGTFTVSSDATSDNTASTIVYRDASGDFSAGNITPETITIEGSSTGRNVTCTNPGSNLEITTQREIGAIRTNYLTLNHKNDTDNIKYGSLTGYANDDVIAMGITDASGSWIIADQKDRVSPNQPNVTGAEYNESFILGDAGYADPITRKYKFTYDTDSNSLITNYVVTDDYLDLGDALEFKFNSNTSSTIKGVNLELSGSLKFGTNTVNTTDGYKFIPTGGSNGQVLSTDGSGTYTWVTKNNYSHPTGNGNKHIPTGGSNGQVLSTNGSGTYTWVTKNNYSHPTSAGNKHIPSGGSTGQILKYSGSSGTAIWDTLDNVIPTEIAKIQASDAQFGDYFGWSVAAGSNRIVVGAYLEDTAGDKAGAAYIFDLDGNEIAKIQASDAQINDFFGYSVAAGSNRIVVGANESTGGTNAGAAYIFDLDGNEITKILASDAQAGDLFGYSSVAVGSGRIVVGAHKEDAGGSDAGAAYIFDLDGNELSKITASDIQSSDYFGHSVGVGSGRIVVGAYREDVGGTNAGAAYIFDLDGNEITKILASDKQDYDGFGYSVAAGSNRIVVGAYAEDTGGSNAGAAYIFDLDGNEIAKIQASDAQTSDEFGWSVGVGSGRIVVGSYLEDVGGSNAGAAYIFDLDGNELAKIQASDKQATDYFGHRVGVGSGRIVVGAYKEDAGGNDSGAAYIFDIDTNDVSDISYSTASPTNLGLVKTGYTENGKNYPVELSSGKMYVNVPWSNTTYSTATSSTAGLVKTGYTENGKNYPVELSSGKMYVNVPWPDTYTHPTSAGNKHIPSGGSSGQVLEHIGSSGTAMWSSDINTSINGLNIEQAGSSTVYIGPASLVGTATSHTSVIIDSLTNSRDSMSGGWDNTFIGYNCGADLVDGAKNTFIGADAGKNISNGYSNCAVGKNALNNNNAAAHNVAIGDAALFYLNRTGNTVQTWNIALGSHAGGMIGSDVNNKENVFLGAYAGYYRTSSNLNLTAVYRGTYVGFKTRSGGDNGVTNEIVIGNKAIGNGSNTITLGDTYITDLYTSALIHATATSAQYADIAERYEADSIQSTATVMGIGGDKEITLYQSGMELAGVISENPAVRMNDGKENQNDENPFIALKGRIPVKIEGSAKKGQLIIAHDNGLGKAIDDVNSFKESRLIIGIALADGTDEVEVKV